MSQGDDSRIVDGGGGKGSQEGLHLFVLFWGVKWGVEGAKTVERGGVVRQAESSITWPAPSMCVRLENTALAKGSKGNKRRRELAGRRSLGLQVRKKKKQPTPRPPTSPSRGST